MLSGLGHKISILTCKLFLERFEGQRKFESDGFSEQVYLFKAPYILGLSTVWGDIMMNERLFKARSKNSRRHVFLHELGHKNTSTALSILSASSQMLLHPLTLPFGILFLMFLVINSIPSFEILRFLSPIEARNYLSIISILYLTAMAISHLSETWAQLFSIRYMGQKEFVEAYEEGKELQPEWSLFRKAVILLSHPPPELVLRIHGFLQDERTK